MWVKIAYLVGMIIWTLITGSAAVKYGEEKADTSWRKRWNEQSHWSRAADCECKCRCKDCSCNREAWRSPNPLGAPMGATSESN